MTTEVLRNMLLTDSDQIRSLGLVVLDEVHYLQDPFRGGVWEEVIILTPAAVRFVALSATIGNARFLGEWFSRGRGPDRDRGRERAAHHLHNHVAVVRRGQTDAEVDRPPRRTRLSDEARRIDNLMKSTRTLPARAQVARPQVAARRRRRFARRGAASCSSRSSARTCYRSSSSSSRARRATTPSTSAGATGCCFTTARAAPRDRSDRRVAAGATSATRTSSRSSTGSSSTPCAAGSPMHHAGMVPAFREIVEACFELNLLGVVFATETLALGVNMPARSVALERFSKYSDAGRKFLTSAEFAQMTGRAGVAA